MPRKSGTSGLAGAVGKGPGHLAPRRRPTRPHAGFGGGPSGKGPAHAGTSLDGLPCGPPDGAGGQVRTAGHRPDQPDHPQPDPPGTDRPRRRMRLSGMPSTTTTMPCAPRQALGGRRAYQHGQPGVAVRPPSPADPPQQLGSAHRQRQGCVRQRRIMAPQSRLTTGGGPGPWAPGTRRPTSTAGQRKDR